MKQARLIRHFISGERTCPYLPEQRYRMEYRIMTGVGLSATDALLKRGWRRFGPAYFRPACSHCERCVSIRLSPTRFVPSKSQKRAYRKYAKGLRWTVSRPRVDRQRLDLYERWYHMRQESRGWEEGDMSEAIYEQQFAFGVEAAWEYAFWDQGNDHLVGVSLVDRTQEALSAVFTFYDPDYRSWSPGTLSILHLLEEAARLGLRWVYLGYRIEGCKSSEYKASYRPHELLFDRPEAEVLPIWRPGP